MHSRSLQKGGKIQHSDHLLGAAPSTAVSVAWRDSVPVFVKDTARNLNRFGGKLSSPELSERPISARRRVSSRDIWGF